MVSGKDHKRGVAMANEKYYLTSIENILADARISESNLETLKKYDTQGQLQQITTGTRKARLEALRQLALFVARDFKKMKKEDMEKYFSSLKDLKKSTLTVKGAYIKSFFKWLCRTDEYPANVKWIKTTLKKQNHKLPTDLLTKEEIKAMVDTADVPMEKAFIMVLYESACRIGEILNLKIKDVSSDQYGCVIVVDGKTGMRRIRLIESSPDLLLWLNNHPKKQDREASLFIHLIDHNHHKAYGKGIDHPAAQCIINRLSNRAGITKRIHPHLFRHSRLTELARDFSESELKIMAGWTGSSNMAGVYIHLTGGDIEKKILEKNGLINQDDDPDKDTLKPKECSRCKEINPNTSKFCYVCGMPLDIKANVEIEPLRPQQDNRSLQSNDVLSRELLQFIIKKHPDLVLEFLRDNGLNGTISSQIRDRAKSQVIN